MELISDTSHLVEKDGDLIIKTAHCVRDPGEDPLIVDYKVMIAMGRFCERGSDHGRTQLRFENLGDPAHRVLPAHLGDVLMSLDEMPMAMPGLRSAEEYLEDLADRVHCGSYEPKEGREFVVIQADPHPGNWVVSEEGRWRVIDLERCLNGTRGHQAGFLSAHRSNLADFTSAGYLGALRSMLDGLLDDEVEDFSRTVSVFGDASSDGWAGDQDVSWRIERLLEEANRRLSRAQWYSGSPSSVYADRH